MVNRSDKRAFHGTIYLMIAQMAIMGGSYIIAVVLARGLGPELYGVYGIVYSILLSVELVGRLGFPQATAKLIAEADTDEHVHEATGFSLAIIVYGLIFATFWFSSPYLAQLFNVTEGADLFRIASLDIPFYGVYFMMVHILAGHRRFLQQSIANIVYIAVKIVGILVLEYIGPTVNGALLVNVVGSVLALLVTIPLVGLRPFRLTLRHSKPLLLLAGPAALIALGTQVLMGVDLWLLNALGSNISDTIKGYYVAAMNIARIPSIVAFVLTSVLVPTIARALKTGDRATTIQTLHGAVRFMAIGLLASSALMAANSNEIMTLLFSSEYANGANLLSVLVFAQGFFVPVYMVMSNVLFATGDAARSATLSMIVVVLAFLVCSILVILGGAYGASLGSLITTALATAAIFVVVKRTVGFVPNWLMVIKVTAAVAIVTFISFLFEVDGILLIAEFAVIGLLYLATLFVFGLVTREDLDLLVPNKRSSKSGAIAQTTSQG
ncbi:MAG: oligosaccharide flippase family protein [Pseudomonadota bacterium]